MFVVLSKLTCKDLPDFGELTKDTSGLDISVCTTILFWKLLVKMNTITTYIPLFREVVCL